MFAYPSIVLTYKYATIRKPGSGMKSRQRLSSTQTSSLHEVLLGVIVFDHEPGLRISELSAGYQSVGVRRRRGRLVRHAV